MRNDDHPFIVPFNEEGSRQETAILLVGTAEEYDFPQSDIRVTHEGYRITERLANVIYDVDDESDEPKDDKGDKGDGGNATKKTSGNRAAKNDSQKGNDT